MISIAIEQINNKNLEQSFCRKAFNYVSRQTSASLAGKLGSVNVKMFARKQSSWRALRLFATYRELKFYRLTNNSCLQFSQMEFLFDLRQAKVLTSMGNVSCLLLRLTRVNHRWSQFILINGFLLHEIDWLSSLIIKIGKMDTRTD